MLLVLKLFGWVYFALTPSMKRLSGKALGGILRSAGFRRKVVLQNLSLAYPGESNEKLRAELFRKSYESFGQLVLEVLMLFGPMERFARDHAEFHGIEHWHQAKSKGKGVIFLASHVGNWEIMAATGALQHEIDIVLVTKHLKPEWLHQAIEKARLRCGVKATYEPRTLKDVLKTLNGNGTVGFVLDQYAGPPVGVRVPVFGVPVGTSTVIAMIAKRTGAAVLPVVNYRRPDGKHIVEARAPMEWMEIPEDPDRELAANTARYAQNLEKDIHAHPEQWLWTHRRFKGELGPLRESEWSEGRARR